MNKIYALLFSSLVGGFSIASAQTNPTPFNLSSGDYTFTEWASTEPAGTFPANMAFHFTADPNGNNYNPLVNGSQDFNCGYSLSSRPRINGLGVNGISMITTGNPQYNDCTSGSATGARYAGAAVLALNTTGRTNVQVTWTGGTLTVGDGGGSTGSGIPRIFAFELQYRLGTEGDFIDIENAEYVSGEVEHSEVLTTTLPSACDNQAEVQVRWIYKQHSSTLDGAQGTRPQLRLDDITVTSDEDLTIGIDDNIISTLTAFPNPSANGRFRLSSKVSGGVYDIIGQRVVELTDSNIVDLSSKHSGHYFLRTDEGAVIRLMK
jgi:hypothetical protein